MEQELLAAGCFNAPKTIHEVIALLACRLARWDDRWRFSISSYPYSSLGYTVCFSPWFWKLKDWVLDCDFNFPLLISRLFRKYIFGEADEVELKFMNRFDAKS